MKKTFLFSEVPDPRLLWVHNAMAALLNSRLDSVLAGGAPRDVALGRRPRDFDIFIPVPDMASDVDGSPAIGHMANLAWIECEAINALTAEGFTVKPGPGYQNRREVLAVLKTSPDIELIFTTTLDHDDLLRGFDSPLCEARMEREADGFTLETTADFDMFTAGKILGFYADQFAPEYAWQRPKCEGDHIGRLAKAFPDFRPVLLGARAPRVQRATPARWDDDVTF